MSQSSSASPPASPESSRPRWPWLTLLRRRGAVGALLAIGVITLAVVVFAVSRAGPGSSGSGDAAVHSIPTGTALPTTTPAPGGTALPAPVIPAPTAPGGGSNESGTNAGGADDGAADDASADGAGANGLPAPGTNSNGDENSNAGSSRGTSQDGAAMRRPGAAPGADADSRRGADPDGDAASPRRTGPGAGSGSADGTSPNIIPPETPPVTIGQTGPTILSFAAASPVAMCANEHTAKVPLEFRWDTQDASEGWFAAGTTNALYEDATPVDLASRGLSDVVFDCNNNQQIYALTISDGSDTVSATTVVVRRLIWPEE